jgi:hypothetical protein
VLNQFLVKNQIQDNTHWTHHPHQAVKMLKIAHLAMPYAVWNQVKLVLNQVLVKDQILEPVENIQWVLHQDLPARILKTAHPQQIAVSLQVKLV